MMTQNHHHLHLLHMLPPYQSSYLGHAQHVPLESAIPTYSSPDETITPVPLVPLGFDEPYSVHHLQYTGQESHLHKKDGVP